MANFLVRPGMWVRATQDIGPLKKGVEYQVLTTYRFSGHITFVGVEGFLLNKLSGKYIEPVEGKNTPFGG